MDVVQTIPIAEQQDLLVQGLCPRCRGTIKDLRGCGFNPAQVGGCFRFGVSSWECRKMPLGSRSGIHISDASA